MAYDPLNPAIRNRSREVFQSQYNSVQSSYDPRILSKATHKSNQRSRITRPLKSLQSFCNPEILVQLKNIRPENIELGRRPGPYVLPLQGYSRIALGLKKPEEGNASQNQQPNHIICAILNTLVKSRNQSYCNHAPTYCKHQSSACHNLQLIHNPSAIHNIK